ncbi:hypothetical protein [Rhizobium leguminosarum]|uniref:hypothetical protein n=1 Tax=Rhizobium leguminosarum TaxID=384 RepID=UPI001C967BBB|nr:hypothetical protein [Rhizobium leguminosarum]MBY5370570.1 hypothetical protein [Rhizobium leguminosarum]
MQTEEALAPNTTRRDRSIVRRHCIVTGDDLRLASSPRSFDDVPKRRCRIAIILDDVLALGHLPQLDLMRLVLPK